MRESFDKEKTRKRKNTLLSISSNCLSSTVCVLPRQTKCVWTDHKRKKLTDFVDDILISLKVSTSKDTKEE